MHSSPRGRVRAATDAWSRPYTCRAWRSGTFRLITPEITIDVLTRDYPPAELDSAWSARPRAGVERRGRYGQRQRRAGEPHDAKQ